MSELGRRLLQIQLLPPGSGQPIALAGFMGAVEFVGRALLALLFVLEAVSKLQAYSAAERYMAAFGVSPMLLPFAIAAELIGGMYIAVGFYTRPTAFMFAGFCLVTAAVFHARFADHNQLLHFEKDLALAGAFLVLSVWGGGRYALDSLLARSSAALQSSAQGSVPRQRSPDV